MKWQRHIQFNSFNEMREMLAKGSKETNDLLASGMPQASVEEVVSGLIEDQFKAMMRMLSQNDILRSHAHALILRYAMQHLSAVCPRSGSSLFGCCRKAGSPISTTRVAAPPPKPPRRWAIM